jgi:hypothetical protein
MLNAIYILISKKLLLQNTTKRNITDALDDQITTHKLFYWILIFTALHNYASVCNTVLLEKLIVAQLTMNADNEDSLSHT